MVSAVSHSRKPRHPEQPVLAFPACDWCAGTGCVPSGDGQLYPCPECDPNGEPVAPKCNPQGLAQLEPTYEWLPPTKSSPRNGYIYAAVNRMLTISDVRSVACYRVTEFTHGLGCDGRAFHLAKFSEATDPESTSYDVFVCDRPNQSTCECRGFLHHGRCKHITSLTDMIRRELATKREMATADIG